MREHKQFIQRLNLALSISVWEHLYLRDYNMHSPPGYKGTADKVLLLCLTITIFVVIFFIFSKHPRSKGWSVRRR